MPEVRLAPVALLTTGSPVRATAAASNRVVVVLPFVADTSATRCPAASCASAFGAIALITRPLIVAPWPRPVTRESHPATCPPAIATLVRSDRRLMRARTSRHRPGTGSAAPSVPSCRGGWRARPGPRRALVAAAGGGSTATWLTDATRSTTPSGVIDCSCRNFSAWSGPNPGGPECRVMPVLVVPPRCALLDPVHDRPHLVHPVRGAVPRVPDQPDPAAWAEDAGELAEGPVGIEPVERLGDGDRIQRTGCHRQRLGDGGDDGDAGHGGDEPSAHPLDRLGREHRRAGRHEQSRELARFRRQGRARCRRARARGCRPATPPRRRGTRGGPVRTPRPRGRSLPRRPRGRPSRHLRRRVRRLGPVSEPFGARPGIAAVPPGRPRRRRSSYRRRRRAGPDARGRAGSR